MFRCVKAIVVEKARVALAVANVSAANFVKNYGSLGVVDDKQLVKGLKANGYEITENMSELLAFGVLDLRAGPARVGRKAKISVQMLKATFETFGQASTSNTVNPFKTMVEEESKASDTSGLAADQVLSAKRGARKILAKAYGTIVETVASLDKLEEGIVNK